MEKQNKLFIENFERSQMLFDEMGFTIKRFKELWENEMFRNHRTIHSHDFYYMMIVKKGKGYHNIDFVQYELKENTIFFLTPGQVHGYNMSYVEGYVVIFTKLFYTINQTNLKLNDFPFFHNIHNPPVLNIKECNGRIFNLVESLITEYKNVNFGRISFIRSNLEILLIELSRYYYKYTNVHSEIPNETRERLHKLEILIESNYREHKDVSFYAKEMTISTRQLNNITNKSLGKSISDIILDRVIIEAKRLLTYSDITIEDIAWKLKYEDRSYFHRLFKKKVGETPGQFRRRNLDIK